jgi:hypothetical protein
MIELFVGRLGIEPSGKTNVLFLKSPYLFLFALASSRRPLSERKPKKLRREQAISKPQNGRNWLSSLARTAESTLKDSGRLRASTSSSGDVARFDAVAGLPDGACDGECGESERFRMPVGGRLEPFLPFRPEWVV